MARASLDRPPCWPAGRVPPGISLMIVLLARSGHYGTAEQSAQCRSASNHRSLRAAWACGPCRSAPSLPGCPGGVQYGDLLPDLAAQVGGQLLDVVDGVDDHGVGQVLRVERRQLVGQ